MHIYMSKQLESSRVYISRCARLTVAYHLPILPEHSLFNSQVSEYMRLYRYGWHRIKIQEITNRNISYENGTKYKDGR